MTQKIVNICVNLDKRDSQGSIMRRCCLRLISPLLRLIKAQGKPTVTKFPRDPVNFYANEDIIFFSISVIEHGAETVLKTCGIFNRTVWNDPIEEKGVYKFTRVKETARCEP